MRTIKIIPVTDTRSSIDPRITPQGNPELDTFLTRFAHETHPEIYDCRACPQEQSKCPQQLIDQGQSGRVSTLFNSCSDSRAHQGVLFRPQPGDIFSVASPGAFLAPHRRGESTAANWSAIEYAVGELGVKDLVQFGHTECGAMGGLLAMAKGHQSHHRYLQHLLSEFADLPHQAFALFAEKHGRAPSAAEHRRALEYHGVRVATQRMNEFVQDLYPHAGVRVHGWIYDLREANIFAVQPDQSFKAITHLPRRADYGTLPGDCAQGVEEVNKRLVYRPVGTSCACPT